MNSYRKLLVTKILDAKIYETIERKSSFLPLLGNFVRTYPDFFQNFSLPDHEPDRFAGKLVQQKFMIIFSVFVKYRVMTEIDTH